MITAYAIVWPNDPDFLVFRSLEAAEENRAWFSRHHKRDRNGVYLGNPIIVKLCGKPDYAYNCAT